MQDACLVVAGRVEREEKRLAKARRMKLSLCRLQKQYSILTLSELPCRRSSQEDPPPPISQEFQFENLRRKESNLR